MALSATFSQKTFHFNFKARTSRGSLTEKKSWFVKVQENGSEIFGLGEAGPLPGLSVEEGEEFEKGLSSIVEAFNSAKVTSQSIKPTLDSVYAVLQHIVDPAAMPSIYFAFETALLDYLNGGTRTIHQNSFLEGKPIPINGLIWMSGMDMMLQQIEIKIQEGFTCLKLKVGGIDFEKECDILQYVRRKYFRMDITLRLDANGAFKPDEALYKIFELSKFKIHSLEQPLKVGSSGLADLCQKSPIPIALDEELIGVAGLEKKKDLLHDIRPKYIILKPTLHGGMWGCAEWIQAAEALKIGWWMTSALESNVGLNAVAQFTAGFPVETPQGLGTGKIYEDNFESPLLVKDGLLSFQKDVPWGEFNFS
ncbi:MAG: o-succinylbenzoate synthase [Cyclobacteriaceae bacterium]